MTGPARIGIVTDSTADIPPQLAAAEGITVVRLVTTFPDGASFRDGDLPQAEFFERMGRSRHLPTTSQPPVGDFAQAYERLLATCSHVVSIHVSHRLSGTIEAARQAAVPFGDRVAVVDSLNLSWGLGWQVMLAARAARAGATVGEVVATAEELRDRARLVVSLDSLENLARGGRIGALSALVGGLLDLKVLLTVTSEGDLAPLSRARGVKAALRDTLGFVERESGGTPGGVFCVMHAMAPERAAELADAIAGRFAPAEVHVVETGVVIATHTGSGWGIGFIPGVKAR